MWNPSSTELSGLAGGYWSDDLERELQLDVEDGRILASWTDAPHEAVAHPIGPDHLLVQSFVPVPWSPQDVRLQLEATCRNRFAE